MPRCGAAINYRDQLWLSLAENGGIWSYFMAEKNSCWSWHLEVPAFIEGHVLLVPKAKLM